MASIRIVSTSVSPLMLLAMLERARAAASWEVVDDAIQRLALIKAAQDAVLDEAARTPEAPGTALDLGAG